jgi:hypothetical protein
VPARSGLDLVCDEVARLERVTHPARAHRDTVRDANRAELVSNEVGVSERAFYALTEAKEVPIATENSMGLNAYEETRRDSRVTFIPIAGER